MKKLIQKFLTLLGWELRKIQPPEPSGMARGLCWLKENGIHVDTVLDVGASNGCWSRECMEFFPHAHYVLYEPQPVHIGDLEMFKREMRAKVTIDARAVGSKTGRVEFDAFDPFGGAIASGRDKSQFINVPMTTLDHSIDHHQIEGPYLLKLDTHGFEKGILEGATATLRKSEALVIECYNHEIEDDCLLFWELCEFLAKREFRPIYLVDVLNRKVDGSLWQMDLFFIKSDWKGFENRSFR